MSKKYMKEKVFKAQNSRTNNWIEGGDLIQGLSFSLLDGIKIKSETICQLVKQIGDQKFFENDLVTVSCDSEGLGRAQGTFDTQLMFNEETCQYVFRSIDDPRLEWTFNMRDFNGFLFKKEIVGNVFND